MKNLIHPALKESRKMRPAEAPLVSNRRVLTARKAAGVEMPLGAAFSDEEDFAISRRRMVMEQLVARRITDQKILHRFSQIPRHVFVNDGLKKQAYGDCPLAIGEGQTISQPYIVALMSQALQLSGHESVLEIGTGCGYQTSILVGLAKKIYTIERSRMLGMSARTIFRRFQFTNIVMRIGDGSKGWPEYAPFDAILAACVAPKIPEVLLKQLAVGGRLVIPIGVEGGAQDLIRITRNSNGFEQENLGACRFVPMIGRHAFGER